MLKLREAREELVRVGSFRAGPILGSFRAGTILGSFRAGPILGHDMNSNECISR